MATFDYNPITGNLDLVGSGASYINDVVADPTALPVTVGTPPLDSVYLAKAGSGVWLINRRPAGLYCRVANNGNAADWTYLGAFPEVNAAANWEVYGSDATKRLKFAVDNLPTATLRTVDAPDGNGKMLVEGQSIGSTTRASGAFTTLNATNGTLTASAPVLDLSQTWNNAAVTFTGLRFNATDTASAAASNLAEFQLSGTALAAIRKDGSFRVLGTGDRTLLAHPNFALSAVAGGAWVGVNTTISLSSAGNFITAGGLIRLNDVTSANPVELNRDAADTLAQRRTTNPQTFRLYNTFTDASNFERGFMRWSSNVLQIGTEKAGTGSARALELQTDGVTRLTVAAAGTVSTSGNFSCVDLTCSTLMVSSGSVTAAATGALRWNGRARLNSPADSIITIVNAANTDFDRLQFGGTTSSFPALKRSSTTLQVRLADDSAFAPLVASEIGIGVTPERPLHIQGSAAFARIDRQGTFGPAILLTRMATGTTVTSSWLFGPTEQVAGVANDDFAIIDFGAAVSGTTGTQRLTISKSTGQLTVNGNLNLSTKDLVTDTTTGTKIGTGTTQKLGFFNATPIVRPAAIADATDAATTQARLNDLLAAMRSLGLIAT